MKDIGGKMIKLNDLLRFDNETLERVKIKFNQYNGDEDPMDVYLRNPEEINTEWLFWRNKSRYFDVNQIAICFFKLTDDTWLLSTIKQVTNELNVFKGVNYEGAELEEYRSLFGRVIIKYKKKHQTQGVFYKNVMDVLEVEQILPSVFDGDEFPGYDNVRLSFDQLSLIVKRHRKDWVSALENQKAVYLITDNYSGKHYVGSAYGDNGMLFQRWSNYINNGHGGNKLLKEIIEEQGFDYIKRNFQYSILENYNSRVDKDKILKREVWWKETLGSKAFGLNAN